MPRPLGCLLALALAALAPGQETVLTVAPAQALRRDADRWLGINLNYVRDADANRPPAAVPLTAALSDLGVRWLRYPGGEKSDFHRFAVPPYARPAPVSLGWYADRVGQRLDFDAYIATCRAVGAEPYVVVACSNAPLGETERAEEVAHAAAWVRYANRERGYGVRHWEIGNENWNAQPIAPAVPLPPEEMARMVARLAAAMRAVDPDLRLGASGNNADWWRRFLPGAAAHLDFLSVSIYPCWAWRSYDRLLAAPAPNLLEAAGTALRAIDVLPDPADRARLSVRVAEANSVDWSEDGWPKTNTLGHAIATFEILATLLHQPRIACAMLWNTRWMDDAEAPGSQFYAFDAGNRPLPAGMAVALWGRHLHPLLLPVTGGDGRLRAYASAAADGSAWTLWLVNPGRAAVQDIRIDLGGLPSGAATVRRFTGRDPDDAQPAFGAAEAVVGTDGRLGPLACPPLSISVITGRR